MATEIEIVLQRNTDEPLPDEASSGGCSTSRAPSVGLLLGLALLLLRRRRP
jgi:MYXO-CTERM domain-containing protein